MGSAHNGRLQKRAGHSLLYCVQGLVIALTGTDTDVCNTLVGHNRLYIREVQINQGRQVNQVGNSLYRLLQNLICLLQSIRHGCTAIHNLQQLVIGDHNQGIHALFQLLNTFQRVLHTYFILKTERLRNHTDSQNPHILSQSGNNRRSAGTGAAAHSAGYEHHIRTLNSFLNLLDAFFGSLLADLRLGSGTQSLSQLLADLDGPFRLAELQRLLVRIDSDKFYSCNLLIYHAVHRVIAGAADSNHDNSGCGFRIVHHNFKQNLALLFSQSIFINLSP